MAFHSFVNVINILGQTINLFISLYQVGLRHYLGSGNLPPCISIAHIPTHHLSLTLDYTYFCVLNLLTNSLYMSLPFIFIITLIFLNSWNYKVDMLGTHVFLIPLVFFYISYTACHCVVGEHSKDCFNAPFILFSDFKNFPVVLSLCVCILHDAD